MKTWWSRLLCWAGWHFYHCTHRDDLLTMTAGKVEVRCAYCGRVEVWGPLER